MQPAQEINIEYVDNLTPVFTKPKRIKIVLGGRGSTKSTGVADYVCAQLTNGQLWCCAREHQNSIEESVHRTMLDEINRLGFQGFTDTKAGITHYSGGRCFYKGLARNPTSLKSTLSGIDGLWIEEGEDLSENTLRVLTASVRLNATDTAKKLAGIHIREPEIIITMNRGTRDGAVAQKWLKRAEDELERCGYYEDDLIMIVEMNYTDMPPEWFNASGLEAERQDDYENLPRSLYDHKWLGKYLETVENAIILPEWFDAAIDAHKIDRLRAAFEPHGAKIAAHDPSDGGKDAKGYALRHGSIVKKVKAYQKGEIDEGCNWATGEAINDGVDWFVWDGDGMGAGLKGQIAQSFKGKPIKYHMFRGSLSGSGQDNAKRIYQPQDEDKDTKPKTYAETFKNNRAQFYIDLANRFYKTYRCVVKNEYIDPDEMISLDSDGIESMTTLKNQVCKIPRIPNANGLIQILSKKEMAALGIPSPNEGDSVMMSLFIPPVAQVNEPVKIPRVRRGYR